MGQSEFDGWSLCRQINLKSINMVLEASPTFVIRHFDCSDDTTPASSPSNQSSDPLNTADQAFILFLVNWDDTTAQMLLLHGVFSWWDGGGSDNLERHSSPSHVRWKYTWATSSHSAIVILFGMTSGWLPVFLLRLSECVHVFKSSLLLLCMCY